MADIQKEILRGDSTNGSLNEYNNSENTAPQVPSSEQLRELRVNRFNSRFSSQSQTLLATSSLASITNGDRQYHVTFVIANSIVSTNVNVN